MVGRVVSDQFGALGNYPLGAALAVVLVLTMALTLAALFGLVEGPVWAGRRLEEARRRRRAA